MLRKTTRKFLTVLLASTLVFSLFPLSNELGVAKADEDNSCSLIEKYYGDRLMSEEEVAKATQSGGAFELINRSDINYNVKEVDNDGFSLNSSDSSSLPPSVDLRNYEGLNRVTSVKNQGSTGTCWAFASNAASEISIANSLKTNAVTDFSPYQTSYFSISALSTDTSELKGTEVNQAGEGDIWNFSTVRTSKALNTGGTPYQAPSAFFSGVGPTKATDVPFPSGSLSSGTLTKELTSQQRRLSLARLTKWSYLGSLINTTTTSSGSTSYVSTNETVLTRIKSELYKGNAVNISYWGGPSQKGQPDIDTFYNETNKCQFTSSYNGAFLQSNHAVCIVGYVDSFSRTKFNSKYQPSANGAFIVKNSWGTGWGDSGYFYLSYYDQSISSASVFEYDTSSYNGENLDSDEEIIDQYDYISSLAYYTPGTQGNGTPAKWYSNVYTASKKQKLYRIGTYYCSEGKELSYKVYRLKDSATSPDDTLSSLDSPDAEGTFTSSYEGLATIDLENPVQLAEGEKYAIWISQVDNDGDYCAPQALNFVQRYEDPYDATSTKYYQTNLIVSSGESFYMTEGSEAWKTLSAYRNGYVADNYCIKGYSIADTSGLSTVTFNSNGGSLVDSKTVSDGSLLDEPDKPKREGFTFAGWYRDEALSIAYNFDQPVNRNFTLYAKWSAKITYELSGGNNDSSNPDSYFFSVGVKSFADASKKGYEFSGWWTKDGRTDGDWGEQVTSISKDYDKGNISIYAKWKIINYSITYSHLKELDNPNPTSFTCEDNDIGLKELIKPGYRFIGWYTLDGTETGYWGSQVSTIYKGTAENLDLYAWWKLQKFNITYKNVEDCANDNPKTYTIEDDTIYLGPLEDKTGYTFAGWYYKDGSIDGSWGSSCTSILAGSVGNMTLWARWISEGYTVNFEGVDGAQNPNGDVIYFDINTPTIKLQEATKQGYTFEGWYDSNGQQVFEVAGGSLNSLVLTAKWSINSYDVTFNTNGGSKVASQKVDFGKKATRPSTSPTKAGFTFAGWYTDPTFKTAYDFDNKITTKTTIYAKWTVVKVSIYRFCNKFTSEHFYTKDAKEAAALKKQTKNWTYEGVAWTSPCVSNTPVYRFSNKYTGEHFFTLNEKEVATLKKNKGFVYEKVAWYASDTKTNKSINRFLNKSTGEHFFTANANETKVLKKNKYFAHEGIAWYGLS